MHPPVGSNHCSPCSLQSDHDWTVSGFLLYAVTHVLQTPTNKDINIWQGAKLNRKTTGTTNSCTLPYPYSIMSWDTCSFRYFCSNEERSEMMQHTWKKSSCFSGLQKNGCLSTQAVEGRDSASAPIICSIRFCAMTSSDLRKRQF